MRVLGIESSCDETAAAIVEDGRTLLSNVVVSQIDIHKEYGGVVPEVAARSHLEVINPVVNKALSDAELTWDDIDAIAVTYAPGLIGSLLVGTLTARALALLHNKPLYPIHHVEAHVYANFIVQEGHTPPLDTEVNSASSLHPLKLAQSARDASSTATPAVRFSAPFSQGTKGEEQPDTFLPGAKNVSARNGTLGEMVAEAARTPLRLPSNQPAFPMLALIVSGKHSELVMFYGHGDYELLGETRDDAVGEAFDKIAKILGLPYPGGPSIATTALEGDPKRYQLPKARLDSPYDFSFSGLKTATLRAVQREVGVDTTFPSHALAERLTASQRHDFAASFQYTAVKTLVDAAEKAYHDRSPASVVIAGGVAANQELRRQLAERLPLPIEYAPIQLCTDNGAMVATLGYFFSQVKPPTDPRTLKVIPSLSMTETTWKEPALRP